MGSTYLADLQRERAQKVRIPPDGAGYKPGLFHFGGKTTPLAMWPSSVHFRPPNGGQRWSQNTNTCELLICPRPEMHPYRLRQADIVFGLDVQHVAGTPYVALHAHRIPEHLHI